jgi:hypothetical protein
MHRLLLICIGILTATSVHAATVQLDTSPLPTEMLDSRIAYFRPGNFTPALTARIRPTMKAIATAKPRGLIIDLRNNQGGDINAVHALLEALLPKGTPYMRVFKISSRGLSVTAQTPTLKRSTPVIVLRNEKTVNEPDIVVYAVQKLRGAGVVEFSSSRNSLKKVYKQQVRMDQYRPIKESVFFVSPDVRLIGNEGESEQDVIPRAIRFARELSPWDEATNR